MKYSTVSTPVFAAPELTAISCLVQFDDFAGPVPFTATSDDPSNHGSEIFARLIAGDFGEIAAFVAPVKTFDQVKADFSALVQAHLDAQALALGYDDIKTAVTYADEPAVLRFKAEGAALRAWRSRCWETCIKLLTEVVQGTRPIPDSAELVTLLPVFVAP